MIFFDIDGTLLDHESASSAAARLLWQRHQRLWESAESVFCRRWNAITEQKMASSLNFSFLEKGPSCLQQLFDQAGHRLGDDAAVAEFSRYMRDYRENWRLYDDTIACLDDLCTLPLGVISNGDRLTQRAKLDCFGLTARFEIILLSQEFGLAKPDPAIFHQACSQARQAPAACMYVGDNYAVDVMGSKNAGLTPVWLDRTGCQADSSGLKKIDSLRHLPAALTVIAQSMI